MSCCIPETFNPLCALMAEGGGSRGRFASKALENPGDTSRVSPALTKENLALPQGQHRRGPSPSTRGCCSRKGGWSAGRAAQPLHTQLSIRATFLHGTAT